MLTYKQSLLVVAFSLSAYPVLAETHVITRYNCEVRSQGTFLSSGETMNFSVSFDSTNNKAEFFGNLGTADLIAIPGYAGISFVEIVSSGAVQILTIDIKGNAVYSRHTIIFGEILPSQYYGKCKIGGSS